MIEALFSAGSAGWYLYIIMAANITELVWVCIPFFATKVENYIEQSKLCEDVISCVWYHQDQVYID